MRIASALLLSVVAQAASAETLYGGVQAERFEFRESESALLWDFQGWYGGDIDKFVVKTEGEHEDGESSGDLQLLWGRAWTPFFDLQGGVAIQRFGDTTISALVFGTEGKAPYMLHIDAAAFISEDGDVSVAGEVEKDFYLTERWLLQPRAELGIAFSDVPELAISSGITELELGLRLRYEVTRKLAPYVGVSFEKVYGDTARALRAAGDDDSDVTLVAGLRFWF